MNKGDFYNDLVSRRDDTPELKSSMEECMSKLLALDTNQSKPGMLLGKIQSGKTRAFIGVIALAFDNNYDVALILTKGTKALSEQTLSRLVKDFGPFFDDGRMEIHDIMTMPSNLNPFELRKKMVIVAKKQTDNLTRALQAFVTTYPELQHKRILIIDDEADFASVNFRREKESGEIVQGKIAAQIDELRGKFAQSDFLQVTATPYSLYLQPDQDGMLFTPKRPAFTTLVHPHANYVGGDQYFSGSSDPSDPSSYLYHEVAEEELAILKPKKTTERFDRRSFRVEEVFTSDKTRSLRTALITFIVGGCIRRIQQQEEGARPEYYSFAIHTEQARMAHEWQEELITRLNEELLKIASHDHLLDSLTKTSYVDLSGSVEASGFQLPALDAVTAEVRNAITSQMIVIQRVNSDADVRALLDSKGELRLRTPLNIFIGGQILDRGITIRNLIGFYYGRNPGRFQQDTVLQHSRMYGNRPKPDLAVTRFYTTRRIYNIMRRIHEFDSALREAFLTGSHDGGVYFIRSDESRRLVPCAPNKILLSAITTLRPLKRLLPYGFQTKSKTTIRPLVERLNKKLVPLVDPGSRDTPVLVELDFALKILEEIAFTFEPDPGYEELKTHKVALEYLSKNSPDTELRGKVWILVREGRANQRMREGGVRFFDAPDTSQREGRIAHEVAREAPILMLFQQEGSESQGWRGGSFWWPVIYTPASTPTTIFASDVISDK